MLSNINITDVMESGGIRIVPPPSDIDIDACSIDLHLAAQYYTIDPTANRDPVTVEMRDEHLVPRDGHCIVLQPGEFVIARTVEQVFLSNEYVGELCGKSSLARIGIDVHSTSPKIKPGFFGVIILELFNKYPYPIKLTVGEPICSLTFTRLDTPTDKPYSGRFQGQA